MGEKTFQGRGKRTEHFRRWFSKERRGLSS